MSDNFKDWFASGLRLWMTAVGVVASVTVVLEALDGIAERGLSGWLDQPISAADFFVLLMVVPGAVLFGAAAVIVWVAERWGGSRE